jgi:TonB family protein
MISIFAGLMLQAAAPPAPPPPPPPPPKARAEPARARANLGSLISNEDYPAEALRNELEGTVGFRLNVGRDGTVTGCTVSQSSGHDSLDSTTCRLLTARARFTPARDTLGRATTDSVSGRIVWRIEEDSALPPIEPILAVSTTRATAAGELTCLESVGDGPLETRPCDADGQAAVGEAARSMGRPVEQTLVIVIIPAGEAEPADRADRGSLWGETEAAFSIAADGSVLECRLVRNEALGPAAGRDPPPNPCETFEPGAKMFQPAAAAAPTPRAVTVKFRGYMKD